MGGRRTGKAPPEEDPESFVVRYRHRRSGARVAVGIAHPCVLGDFRVCPVPTVLKSVKKIFELIEATQTYLRLISEAT
jgi:hypothetical protein